ncbi:Fc.00g029090.m01.CDS01 [Cosmosporella sp. VM-42]
MAPITPHWQQPSHPDVLEVIVNAAEFTSKSLSRVTLPPFAVFAKFSFPPCTTASEPTYATVQMGKDSHLNLNSDLLYINHSCEPSLIFDVGNFNVLVGANGLKPGDDLTFFYPSTEWYMAQPFDCLCGKPTCRGRISGARDMTKEQLQGIWLNGHIIELLKEQERGLRNGTSIDPTAQALQNAFVHAQKVVEAARLALQTYTGGPSRTSSAVGTIANGRPAKVVGAERRGRTSRELSGEMGGDTIRV